MRTVDPERHEARRRQILEAAAELFAERGYDGVTTTAIHQAAGIGSGTLFHYFPTKRSIFHDLFADDLDSTTQLVAALDESDPMAAVVALVEHRTADVGNPLVPGLLMAAITHAGRDEEFAELIARDEAFLHGTFSRLLTAAAAAGQIDAQLDPAGAARWISTLIDALHLQAGGPGFDAEADTATLLLILRRYLQPGGHRD